MMAAMNTATTESRRGRATAPWNQILRGGESEPEPSVSGEPSSPSPPMAEDSVGEGSGGGNAGKRQAWNKQPPNGASEVGPVMGAESWPALGEAARFPAKPSSETLKGLSDGVSSVPSSQVPGTTISTTITHTNTAATTSSPRKQAHSTSTSNHSAPVRSKSMKRNNSNASSSSSNGSLPQPQQEVAAQPFESFSNNPSPRDNTPRSGGFVSHPHGGGDLPHLRNSSFRNRSGGGGGPHPRGDGSHHHSYGGRRDHDRGNHEWNSQNRSFNGRDSHIHQHRGMPRIHSHGPPPPPPPAPSSPFFPPQGLRHYVPTHPMQFPGELPPPHQPQIIYMPPHGYVGVSPLPPIMVAPIVPAPPPAVTPTPTPEAQLAAKIVNQVDYYFSFDNLIKDEFLRKKMNIDGGWVAIEVIAGFQKVLELTKDHQFILDSLKMAKNVEVQDKFIRKRGDWGKWIYDPPITYKSNVNVLTPRTPVRSSDDNLSARVQSIALEERNVHTSASDHNSSYQPQLSNGDVGGNPSFSGRS